MPYKDPETAKVAARDRQRKHREGVTEQGVTDAGVTLNKTHSVGITGSKDIKELLPEDIVTDIIALGEYDRTRDRNITLEGRFRRAYEYQVWHDKNFVNGIHRDSKYREFVR